MHTKKCSKCKNDKDISCFNRLSAAKDGLHYKCRACIKEEKAEDWRRNPEKRRAAVRKWREKNIEKAREAERIRTNRWNNENRSRRRELTKVWFDKNPGIKAMYAADRRAALLQQTIPLSNEQINEIIEIYRKAKMLSNETGITYHVDHIIPLRAKNCSGLHVPWNLQIIPAEENFKKNNSIPRGASGIAFL